MEDIEQHETKEIKEYERLIEFARQIQNGLHPRIKIPSRLPHLIERVRPDPSKINSSIDHYHALGITPECTQDSIMRAYKARWALCSPISDNASAITRWDSRNKKSRVLKKVRGEWERLQTAFKILRDPEMRSLYDARRALHCSRDSPSVDTKPGTLPTLGDCGSVFQPSEDTSLALSLNQNSAPRLVPSDQWYPSTVLVPHKGQIGVKHEVISRPRKNKKNRSSLVATQIRGSTIKRARDEPDMDKTESGRGLVLLSKKATKKRRGEKSQV